MTFTNTELALQINENIAIAGDLNSDLFSTNNNKLIDLMNNFNLGNVIDKPTRVKNHSSTLLDPIILSDNLKCAYSDVLNIPQNISDYHAAIAMIDCPKRKWFTLVREIWQYDKIDKEKFVKQLDEINWNDILETLPDVDDMCEEFTKTVLKIAWDCVPIKEITIRENDKPWFNNILRKEIRICDRLRKKF